MSEITSRTAKVPLSLLLVLAGTVTPSAQAATPKPYFSTSFVLVDVTR